MSIMNRSSDLAIAIIVIYKLQNNQRPMKIFLTFLVIVNIQYVPGILYVYSINVTVTTAVMRSRPGGAN